MALLLRESDVEGLVDLDAAIGAVETAFRDLAQGRAENCPRSRASFGGATLNVLYSFSTRLDAIALKSYPIVRSDVTVGSSFVILVYSLSGGALRGIVEADRVGQIRTGAASAVAARAMARPDSRVLTLFGAGWQAESQLEALARVLPSLERVFVVSRRPERARDFCRRMSSRVALDLAAADSVEQAVAEADVVTTATGATEPLFDGRWLRPGTHVNAVGSNFATKREIDRATVLRASVIVADDVEVASRECGDLVPLVEGGHLSWESVEPLADVVAGRVPGRRSPLDITLFESQGLSIEDLAVACLVLERARQAGVGLEVEIR